MAACRYILFTVYSPLPSVPPHRLIYGFPSRYSSPSCSSRALRSFLRVYPDLARASFTCFVISSEKGEATTTVNQFTHFSYPSAIDHLFLLWGSEISRRDKFGVGRFIFVQSKVAFLSSWHKFRLSPTFFFPRQRRITEGRERGNVATRCLMLAIYVCRSLPSRVEFVTSWRQLFTLSFPLAS